MIGQRIGHYRVVRQLGEGGMGVVYEGIRDDIGGRAAVKVLRPEYARHPETAARFFNEARATNLIEHPGIVKIFDYGQLPNGATYLAMELLDGESLHQRLHRERRLRESDALRLGRQVAAALAAAHAKQVIHRDLKPENIYVVPDAEAPGGERAKILDFGIAKLAREQSGSVRTHTNVMMGTPIYMSPEQCKGGKNVDERADVYALGVILFEMLSGRPPFVAEEAGEYIGMHLFKPPPPLGSLVPTANPALQRLVDVMLSKEPEQRPLMTAVANILKQIGNLQSDVISVRKLEAEAVREPGPRRSYEMATVPGNVDKLAAVPASLLPPPAAPLNPEEPPTVRKNQPPVLSPNDATALMGAKEFAALGLDQKPPGSSSLPPDWQPVQIVAAPVAPLGNLDADSLIPSSAERRPRTLGKRLRRLLFQIKKLMYGWLGIPVAEPRNTPAGTPAKTLQALIIIGAAMALAALIWILVSGGL